MPNVIVRSHYYEKGSSHRTFYDSNQKDDYLAYMDKGIKSGESIDYLDYTGNEEKSSGVFNADGILSKADKKALREKLRKTDSIIWDIVISFEKEFGEQNVYNAEQAQALLKRVLPRFFRESGLKPENITWYAGLHTNTDNRYALSRSNDLKRLLRNLYEEIPYESRIAYESENMNGCRDTINSIVSYILSNGENSIAYRILSDEIDRYDGKLIKLCEEYKIGNIDGQLLGEKFQKDLYRRMGNIVIKEVLKKRRDEIKRSREIRHAKARQKQHIDSLAECLMKSAEIAAHADQEAIDCFEEFMEKLEEAEIQRKLAETEM